MTNRTVLKQPEHHLAVYGLLLVLFVGIVGIVSISRHASVGHLLWIPRQGSGTVVIAGLDLNDLVGVDVSSLTDAELVSLGSGRINTRQGSTRVEQVLRLRSTNVPTFDGGKIVFEQDEDGSVSDFLRFSQNSPIFEVELVFGEGLQSQIDESSLPDLEGTQLSILGKEYELTQASVNTATHQVRLRFFGDVGEVDLEDTDYSDSGFVRGVRVNGKSVNAQVQIRAVEVGSRLSIVSIKYRPLALRRGGDDIRVHPLHGVRGILQDSSVLLSSSFDLIYGGLGGVISTSSSSVPSVAGNKVELRGVGGQRYSLRFVNTRGIVYNLPLVELDNGVLVTGEGSRRFVVKEADTSVLFNINEGDYFALTSANDINGVTNIMRLSRVEFDNRQVFVDDLGGGSHIVTLDSVGQGSLVVGGMSYALFASNGTNRIAVDQTGDGVIDGSRAKLVVLGGAMLEPSSSSLVLRIVQRLFSERTVSSDETVTITFVSNSGDIDVSIPSSSTLTLKRSSDFLRRGSTPFGVLFSVNDDNAPSKVSMDIPLGQRGAVVSVGAGFPASRGQRQAFVVVTTEREKFLPKK
ncbi:MAG: hypothetical protein AABX52_02705 [Nanoarchaeota archaeon]